jgi:hypothetical protein
MDSLRIYNQIIERAQKRQLEGYVEKHHLVPRCLGGSDSKDNIVELTAREHFLCHMLLVEIYPNSDKLKYALYLMNIGKQKNKNADYQISSRTYERLKKEHSLLITGKPNPGVSLSHKGREITWKVGPPKGQIKPKGFGDKLKVSLKGRIINNKPILQYDLQGNFIKEWISSREVHRQLGIHYGSISMCCLNKTKTSGGFVWKYK